MTLVLGLFLLQIAKVQVSVGDQQKVFDIVVVEEGDYLKLDDLCTALDLQFAFDSYKQRVMLIGPAHEVVLYLNIGLAKINGAYQVIAFAPTWHNGEILFPKPVITSFFTRHFGKVVLVQNIDARPGIESYKLSARGDSVVFHFETEYETETDLEFEGTRVVFEINGLLPAVPKSKVLPGLKLVKDYEVTPFQNYSRFTFNLADKHINAVVRENEVVFVKELVQIVDLIVLDAGHGGIDPGAVGKKGLYEKDCNLAITLRLKDLIEDSLGIKVVMTRDDDKYLSLGKRTKFANRNRADLFVSIHCNASKKRKQPDGMETYFLSEAKTDEARATAALENASLQFDEPEEYSSELARILSDMAQAEFLQESSDLAENIQEEATKRLPVANRGLNQANFYVLKGAFMAAALVECAFISNPAEEKLLRDKKFRNSVAHGIFCGIKKFVVKYEARRLN